MDIESILDVNPSIDIKRIRSWVKEFSDMLEMPEIIEDLNRILNRKNRYKPKIS